MWRSKILSPLALTIVLTFSFVCHSHSEVSISDPLWDWKYDAIERLSLAFGKSTVSNTRPMSRLEMADMVLRLSEKAEADGYYMVLLKRLEDDLREEIKSINEGTSSALKVKPLRWVRVKAVHSDLPFQIENDYGLKSGDLSLRGELSTSGTWGFAGYDIRPQYNFLKVEDEAEDELKLHSGYLVIWLKNLEIEVGKDALWWGPGRHGNWVLTNNAPAFDLIKLSNAVTAVPPGPLKYLGDTKAVVFLGKLSEQEIVYTDRGLTVAENKKPLFAGFRLDFSPSRNVEIGASQAVEFIDRGGRGYPLDYVRRTFIASWESNEEEASSGPVANRITSMDISMKVDGQSDFMKAVGLTGAKIYWETGGETMARDNKTKLPRFSNTSNIYGLYLDTGRTDFRAEYASNYDVPVSWYDHYQFTGGYRNKGFVLGHHMGGHSRDLFLTLSSPVSGNISAGLHYDGREQKDNYGERSREHVYGVSVDTFGERGENMRLSYEYRKGDDLDEINQVWAVEGVYRF